MEYSRPSRTWFYSHTPLPTATNSICVGLQRASGMAKGERKTLTTGTRKLGTAPCLSSSRPPAAAGTEGHKGTPLVLLSGQHQGPPLPGLARMPPRAHQHPAGKPKPGIFWRPSWQGGKGVVRMSTSYLAREAERTASLFAELRTRAHRLTAGLNRLEVNLSLAREIHSERLWSLQDPEM